MDTYRIIDGRYLNTKFLDYHRQILDLNIKEGDLPDELTNYQKTFDKILYKLKTLNDYFYTYSHPTAVEGLMPLLYMNFNLERIDFFKLIHNANPVNVKYVIKDNLTQENTVYFGNPGNLENITTDSSLIESHIKTTLNNEDVIIKHFGGMRISTYTELLENYPTNRDKLVIYFGKGSFLNLNKNQLFITLDFIKYMQSRSWNYNNTPTNLQFLVSYICHKFIENMKNMLIDFKMESLLGDIHRMCEHTLKNNSVTTVAEDILAKLVFGILQPLKNICESSPIMLKLKFEKGFKTIYLNDINRRLTAAIDNLNHYDKRYKEELNKKYALEYEKCYVDTKIGKDFDKFFNYMELMLQNNVIRNYNIDISDRRVAIELEYGFTQITYYDADILNSCLNNKWHLNDTLKKELQEVLNGNRKLWSTPVKLSLEVYLSDKSFCINNIKRESPFSVTNGHIDIPCYGSFNNVLKEAAQGFEFNKLIAYFTQFLQSAAPADGAGERAFLRPLITDNEGNITYARTSDNTELFKAYNIFDYNFNENKFEKRKEQVENANS